MTTSSVSTTAITAPTTLRRVLLVVTGALLVAAGAQVAIPIPGSPVPMTLQVPAVLIVGGLLGPRLGVAGMVLYLVLGVGGLPVFQPLGAPGLARLFGPTGGYLLALPLAAGLAGALSRGGRSWRDVALAVVVGMVAIHAGGVAQLAAMGLDVSEALRLGSLPFLASDALKLLFAGLIILKFGRKMTTLR